MARLPSDGCDGRHRQRLGAWCPSSAQAEARGAAREGRAQSRAGSGPWQARRPSPAVRRTGTEPRAGCAVRRHRRAGDAARAPLRGAGRSHRPMAGLRTRRRQAHRLPGDERWATAAHGRVPARQARRRRAASGIRQGDASRGTSSPSTATRSPISRSPSTSPSATPAASRTRRFTVMERKRLDTAQQLLTIAIDQAATPAERQVAYRRVREELDGLISLSDEAIEVLEGKVALELHDSADASGALADPRRAPATPPAPQRNTDGCRRPPRPHPRPAHLAARPLAGARAQLRHGSGPRHPPLSPTPEPARGGPPPSRSRRVHGFPPRARLGRADWSCARREAVRSAQARRDGIDVAPVVWLPS